jgi:hypothetical protein
MAAELPGERARGAHIAVATSVPRPTCGLPQSPSLASIIATEHATQDRHIPLDRVVGDVRVGA